MLPCTLPAHKRGVRWELLLDTVGAERTREVKSLKGGDPYDLEARSLALFRLRAQERKTNGSAW